MATAFVSGFGAMTAFGLIYAASVFLFLRLRDGRRRQVEANLASDAMAAIQFAIDLRDTRTGEPAAFLRRWIGLDPYALSEFYPDWPAFRLACRETGETA